MNCCDPLKAPEVTMEVFWRRFCKPGPTTSVSMSEMIISELEAFEFGFPIDTVAEVAEVEVAELEAEKLVEPVKTVELEWVPERGPIVATTATMIIATTATTTAASTPLPIACLVQARRGNVDFWLHG